MTQTNEEVIKPWYQQFWLWFLVFFPLLAVVAGLITVVIAFKNEDSLVRDDYYKAGLAINSRLALDHAAEQQAIHAQLTIDKVIGEIHLKLQGNLKQTPESLTLDFIHPTRQADDFSVQLLHSRDFQYVGQLNQAISNRWHIQLTDNPKTWRLKTVAKIPVIEENSPESLVTITFKQAQ